MAVSGIRVRSAASGEGGRSRQRAVQSGADRRIGRGPALTFKVRPRVPNNQSALNNRRRRRRRARRNRTPVMTDDGGACCPPVHKGRRHRLVTVARRDERVCAPDGAGPPAQQV